MNYLTGVLNGFLFGIGLFLANVLVQALFHRALIG